VARLKTYVVTIGGLPHTMRLDDHDAAKYGDRAVPLERPPAEEPEQVKPKARRPANKARTAKNKA
jgi:hypothetical protein